MNRQPTWKLSSGTSASGFLGFGGGRGAALLGFFTGLGKVGGPWALETLGKVGGGNFFRIGAPSLSGIGARVGGGV